MKSAQPDLLASVDAANSNPPPVPAQEQPGSDFFNWSRDDSVIISEQPATAVYSNPKCGIVIRQEANGFQDGDPFVFFSTPAAPRKVVEAILRELGHAE